MFDEFRDLLNESKLKQSVGFIQHKARNVVEINPLAVGKMVEYSSRRAYNDVRFPAQVGSLLEDVLGTTDDQEGRELSETG